MAGVGTTEPKYTEWLIEMAEASAVVANFCDHREHVEDTDPDEVKHAAQTMGGVALAIAAYENIDIQKAYAQRIDEIEKRNVLWTPSSFDGAAGVRQAETWLDIQLVQVTHNVVYHPDVNGLSRLDQLRHYAFHTAKLTGAVASVVKSGTTQEFLEKRLPDIAIFRVLIATAVNQALPDSAVA